MTDLIAKTTLETRIAALITPVLLGKGYEVVRVRLFGQSPRTLQIMAEQTTGTMDIDDCALLSRMVSVILDAEDIIKDPYTLELSSPGIDRPLTRFKDFDHWVGHKATIHLHHMHNNRRHYSGYLAGTRQNDVVITVSADTTPVQVCVPFECISSAKLVLTSELIKATSVKASPPRLLCVAEADQ